MIVVTVELWPYNDPARRQLLGRAVIANDGTGTNAQGSYDAVFNRKRNKPVWRSAHVTGFRRSRYSVWHLLAALLNIALGSELGKATQNLAGQVFAEAERTSREQEQACMKA